MPEDELQAANAVAGLTGNLAEFAGPALATALVLRVGAGWAFALDAATFLASAICLAGVRARPRFPILTGLLLVLLWPISLVAFALGLPLAVVLAVTVAAGAGVSLFEVWWTTALAQRIPPHLLSRVTSYDYLGSLLLLPLGLVLAGPVAAEAGSAEVLAGGAVLGAVFPALGLVPRETRMLGRLDEPLLPTAGREPRVPV